MKDSMKEEIKELAEAMRTPGATSVETEGSEGQQKLFKSVMAAGGFVLLLLLGIGTQQAIIKITSVRVAEVTHLEERAIKAEEAKASAARVLQVLETETTKMTARKANLTAEVASADSKLSNLLEAVAAAENKLAAVKDAVLAEEERLAEVKITPVTTVPVVATEPAGTLTTTLVARMRGWLK